MARGATEESTPHALLGGVMKPNLTLALLDAAYDEWPLRNRNHLDMRFAQYIYYKYDWRSDAALHTECRHLAYKIIREELVKLGGVI